MLCFNSINPAQPCATWQYHSNAQFGCFCSCCCHRKCSFFSQKYREENPCLACQLLSWSFWSSFPCFLPCHLPPFSSLCPICLFVIRTSREMCCDWFRACADLPAGCYLRAQPDTRERGWAPLCPPSALLLGCFPLHICTIWNPLQLTKPSLLNMEKLGVTKMPMVGTVYCVWIWDLIILFKNEAVVVLHIDWWDLLWFDLYFYIVLKICGTTTMFVEKQACPDQEAFLTCLGILLFPIAKKTFCSNRAVWFPPKENCSRGSLNRNYYPSSMSSFTLKAADVFVESQNYLSWKRPERSPRCNFLQQIKYY